jgi:hypothetical protein
MIPLQRYRKESACAMREWKNEAGVHCEGSVGFISRNVAVYPHGVSITAGFSAQGDGVKKVYTPRRDKA